MVIDSRMQTVQWDARKAFSLAALVVTSLIPLFGVLVLDWDVYPLMLLFWVENVMIGFFNALSMLATQPDKPLAWVGKCFLVPFFCFHYGMFTLVHGVFVLALFGGGVLGAAFPSPPVFWREFARLGLGASVLALGLAHLGSFVLDDLATGDYKRKPLEQLMMRPYGRILVLHIALLAGGWVTQMLRSPTGALLVLVALKLALDLRLFRKDHIPAPA